MKARTSLKRIVGGAGLVLVLALGVGPRVPGQGSGTEAAVLRRCRVQLREARAKGITVGFLAQRAGGGEPLLAQEPDEPLIPASNMKIVTAAGALLGLGADHEMMTDLVAHGELEDGVLTGSLRLRGEGDPTLESGGEGSILEEMVRGVKEAGIREVRGDLLVDDRLFDREFIGPQWPVASPTRPWMAQVAALSLDHGTVAVQVSAAREGKPRARVRPAGTGVTLENGLRPARRKKDHLVDVQRTAGSNRMELRGKVAAGTEDAAYPVAIHDPAMIFGRALRAALAEAGVGLRGAVRRPEEDEHRQGGRLLVRRRTPLSHVLPDLLKRSQNHRAEMLWKHLGAAFVHEGSFAGGGAACRRIFAEHGLEIRASTFRDGSGLSRGNRLSARELGGILEAVFASPQRATLEAALASGGEGTLRRRLNELGRRVRAKTGTLRGVSGLSGYLDVRGGDTLVFVILMNGDGVASSVMRGLQDRLVRSLARLGRGS